MGRVGSAGASPTASGSPVRSPSLKTGIISTVLLALFGATAAGVSGQPSTLGAERFVLTGLLVWSGKEGVAWLQEPDLTQNQIVTLRIGESVGPWTLTRFLDNGVELEGPAGKVLVPLQNVGGGGTAVAAGAPAGPGTAPASPARSSPRTDASRIDPPPPTPPANPAPGFVWESNPQAPSAGALGEALNSGRRERSGRPGARRSPRAEPRQPDVRAPSTAARRDVPRRHEWCWIQWDESDDPAAGRRREARAQGALRRSMRRAASGSFPA